MSRCLVMAASSAARRESVFRPFPRGASACALEWAASRGLSLPNRARREGAGHAEDHHSRVRGNAGPCSRQSGLRGQRARGWWISWGARGRIPREPRAFSQWRLPSWGPFPSRLLLRSRLCGRGLRRLGSGVPLLLLSLLLLSVLRLLVFLPV